MPKTKLRSLATYNHIWSETWRNKWITSEAKTIDDMINALRASADELEERKNDGVKLDPHGGTADDYAILITKNRIIAKKYYMTRTSPRSEEDIYAFEVGPTVLTKAQTAFLQDIEKLHCYGLAASIREAWTNNLKWEGTLWSSVAEKPSLKTRFKRLNQ